MRLNSKKLRAFTILEVVVVIALLIVFGISIIPFSNNEIYRQRVDNTVQQIYNAFYTQKQKSYAGFENSSHGIRFTNNSFLYQTITDNNSIVEYDETFFETEVILISSNLLNTSNNSIIFTKGSEKTSNSGIIQVGNELITKTISINSQGLIDIYIP